MTVVTFGKEREDTTAVLISAALTVGVTQANIAAAAAIVTNVEAMYLAFIINTEL
ncbi:hypothetical protein MCC01954_01150 [Bifidobacteriaceae bacterium MCC01954]|nr:hypothetical protein MCC01954_01150 [Bifidobacteriaceae bacterium MCC01954]